MKIGISTACLYPLETETALKYFAERGVKDVEVFLNTDSEIKKSFISEIYNIAKDNGVAIYSLHPFMSPVDHFYLFNYYPRRQRDGFDKYRRFFDAAAYLGAKVVNFHGPRKEQKTDFGLYCDIYTKLYREGLSRGIYFSQENVSRSHSHSSAFIRAMAEACADEVSFTLDIKQAHRAGENPFDFIPAMSDKIKLIHCNDYNSDNDCLLPLKGTFDLLGFRRCLLEHGYDGMFTIEVYNHSYTNREEITEAQKQLTELFERN